MPKNRKTNGLYLIKLLCFLLIINGISIKSTNNADKSSLTGAKFSNHAKTTRQPLSLEWGIISGICTVHILPSDTLLENVCLSNMAVIFNNLTVSSLNCNSLNMSKSTKPVQVKKIYSIVKLKSDIIFLSDIRLSTSNVTHAISRLKRDFQVNPYQSYELVYNSTQNKRGVAILIKTGIGLSEITVSKDPEENFLLIKLQDNTGNKLIVGSIYGPNENNPEFFDRLEMSLANLGNHPIIIGGDWNTTYSTENIENNPDCLNMVDVPNRRHSLRIAELCTTLRLTDPYRYLWPNKKVFSYVPRNILRNNRSRIDFFLISTNLLPAVSACSIDIKNPSKIFDHRPILLDFTKNIKKKTNSLTISNWIINDPDIDIVVKISVIETYLIHIQPRNLTNLFNFDPLLLIGNARATLREVGPAPELLPEELVTENTVDN